MTGGTGFVASHIIEALLERGFAGMVHLGRIGDTTTMLDPDTDTHTVNCDSFRQEWAVLMREVLRKGGC